MKLTILTTLLTLSLATAAFSAEEPPAATPQPGAPTASPSSATASPAKSLSLLDTKPQLLGPLATSTPIKLGYIDIPRVFEESRTAKKAVESLKKSRDKFQKQLTEKGKKLEAMKKSLEGKAAQMNQLEREAKAKEFQAKVTEFQESGQKAEKEIAKQAEDSRRKLQEQVAKKVKEYGEKNGYTLIASEPLYSDGNHKLTDVTADVIKELDR